MRKLVLICIVIPLAVFACGPGEPDGPLINEGKAEKTLPQTEVLTNSKLCEAKDPSRHLALAPAEGEFGHWAAARLTPPSYPFTVTAISYLAITGEGSECRTGLGHQVALYVGAQDKPTASPEGVILSVPAAAHARHFRQVILDLDTPVQLSEGQHLFVAVEMAGGPEAMLCLNMGCTGEGTPDRNYWSNAAAPPFDWATLDSFGFTQDISMSAVGYQGSPDLRPLCAGTWTGYRDIVMDGRDTRYRMEFEVSFPTETPLAPSIRMFNQELEDEHSRPITDTFSEISLEEDTLRFKIPREHEVITCALGHDASDGAYAGTCQSDQGEGAESLSAIRMVPPQGC